MDAFHNVGKMFPDQTHVETLAAGTTVAAAVRRMLETRYSQMPVVLNDEVIGVFSLWALAQHLTVAPQIPLEEVPVEEILEQLPFVSVDDPLEGVLKQLDATEAVLVGSPLRLQAIATSWDVLKYFYRVASQFVLVGEIELSIRAVINLTLSDDELREAAGRVLREKYRTRAAGVPIRVQDMTIEDYGLLITSRDWWPRFEGILGKNRRLVMTRLEAFAQIRNTVVHFRDEISVVDYQTLVSQRDWLLGRLRLAGGLAEGYDSEL